MNRCGCTGGTEVAVRAACDGLGCFLCSVCGCQCIYFLVVGRCFTVARPDFTVVKSDVAQSSTLINDELKCFIHLTPDSS